MTWPKFFIIVYFYISNGIYMSTSFKPEYRIDIDWMHKLSHRFERFKTASATTNVYNCRCPVCGDSDTSQKKARFYFYTKQRSLNVICHNCGYSRSFYNFLKEIYPADFDEYKREQMRARVESLGSSSKRFQDSDASTHQDKTNDLESSLSDDLVGVQRILDLPLKHPARVYLKERGFGQKEMGRLLWADDFKETAEDISYEPLSEGFPKEGRIVIPFYSSDGRVEMLQGRSLKQSGLRYLSIKAHPEVDKIYGKYEVDNTKTVYCVEGPFDSLFVDNCLATCDSNLTRANADVFVYDNQPRSKEIVNIMKKTIDAGYKVVIWPTSPNKKEDINDMILQGTTRKELMSILKSNTMKGPKALLAFNRWRKV